MGLAFSAAVLLGGCASTKAKAPVCGAPETWPTGVTYLDGGLIGTLAVQSVQTRPTATGTTEVTASLQNCVPAPIQVEGRVQFLDASNLPVEPVTAWKRVYLAQNSNGFYTERSTRGAVGTYRIEFREGH